MMTNPIEVTVNPLAEIIAKKLSGISGVPGKEQMRMISRAAKASVEYHEKEIAALQATISRLEREKGPLVAVADEAYIIAPRGLLDLVRFMCNVWDSTSKWAFDKVSADALMHYPIIQGTRNQMDLMKIGAQPYDADNIREAVEWMIAEAAIDGGALGSGE